MIKRFVLRDLSKLKLPLAVASIVATAIGFVFFFLAQFSVFDSVKTPMLVMEITSRITLAFVFVTTVTYLASKILRKNYITDLSSMDKIKLAFVRVAEAAVICFAFCSLLLVETTAVDAVVLDKYGVSRELADASFLCFSAVGKGAEYWLLPFTTTVLVVFVVSAVYALKGLMNAMGNTVSGVVVWLVYILVILALIQLSDVASHECNVLYYTFNGVYTGKMPQNTFLAWTATTFFSIGVSQFASTSFMLYDLTCVLLTVILALASALCFAVYALTQSGKKLRIAIPSIIMLVALVLYAPVCTLAKGNGETILGSVYYRTAVIGEGEAYDLSDALGDIFSGNQPYTVSEEEIKLVTASRSDEAVVRVRRDAAASDAYITGNKLVCKKAGVYEVALELNAENTGNGTYITYGKCEIQVVVLPKAYDGYTPVLSAQDLNNNLGKYILMSDIEIDCTGYVAVNRIIKGVLFDEADFHGSIVNPYGYKITLKNMDASCIPLIANLGETGVLSGLIVDGAIFSDTTGAICKENQGAIIDCTVFGRTLTAENYIVSILNKGLIQGCKGFYRNASGGMVSISGPAEPGSAYFDTEIDNMFTEIGGF